MRPDRLEITVCAARTGPTPGALSLPLPPVCEKEEYGTLIWRGEVEGEGRAVFKVYRHRRAAGFRVQREFEALARLASANIPCSAPLFWGHGKSVEHGRYEILATREIPAALSLRDARLGVSAELIKPIYGYTRRMHAAGVYHGALSWKNILVVGGEKPEFFIVDMARSALFPGDIFGTRMAFFDLLHLTRYLSPQLSQEGTAALLRHYGLSELEAARVMKALRRYRPTRHVRNRLQFEFKLRAWWAKRRCRPA